MKKYLLAFVMLIFSTNTYAQKDVTKFMGIPVDGFKQQMFKQLKDKGLEYLQDEEGNVLNIGDALDDNIILNAKYGYSKKYQSIVYVFDNKSHLCLAFCSL